MKRAITDECCHKPCSLKYLLIHYCQEINNTAIENYTKHQQQINVNLNNEQKKQQVN